MFQTIIAFVAGAILAEPAAKLFRPVVKEAAKGGALLTHKISSMTSGARDRVTGAATAAASGLKESEIGKAIDEGIAEAAARTSESTADEPAAKAPKTTKKRATKTAPASA